MKRPSGALATGLRDLLKNLSRAQDIFRKYVLPIYEDNEQGLPELFGTALVVQHRGSVFFVSAKHVLAPLAENRDLYVYCTPSIKRHLGGELSLTNTGGGVDRVDVGVLRLEGEGVPPFPEVNCSPLPSHLLAPSNSSRDGKFYLAIGYPSTRSRLNKLDKTLKAEPYANFGPAISAERTAKLGLDPRLHIAISFHKKRVYSSAGNVESFPNPAGMSGSPVFLLYDKEAPVNTWGSFKVAGILIEYRADAQILLATDIAVAIELMDHNLS